MGVRAEEGRGQSSRVRGRRKGAHHGSAESHDLAYAISFALAVD